MAACPAATWQNHQFYGPSTDARTDSAGIYNELGYYIQYLILSLDKFY